MTNLNLDVVTVTIIIILLWMCSNDIERNPGPTNILHRDLELCHLNIQSLKNRVSERLVAKRRLYLEIADLEAMWLEIRSQNNIFLLCTIYRPPNSRVIFWDHLQEMLDEVKSRNIHNIIITGDLNADDNTRDGAKLAFCTNKNHLTSHVNGPTRITRTTQTRLNKIISNIPYYIKRTRISPPLLSNDHCTICASLKFRTPSNKAYKRQMWDYSQADFVGLRDYLSNVNWNERLGEFRDIEFVASEWPKVILEAATLFIPNKYVTIGHY